MSLPLMCLLNEGSQWQSLLRRRGKGRNSLYCWVTRGSVVVKELAWGGWGLVHTPQSIRMLLPCEEFKKGEMRIGYIFLRSEIIRWVSCLGIELISSSLELGIWRSPYIFRDSLRFVVLLDEFEEFIFLNTKGAFLWIDPYLASPRLVKNSL